MFSMVPFCYAGYFFSARQGKKFWLVHSHHWPQTLRFREKKDLLFNPIKINACKSNEHKLFNLFDYMVQFFSCLKNNWRIATVQDRHGPRTVPLWNEIVQFLSHQLMKLGSCKATSPSTEFHCFHQHYFFAELCLYEE